MRPLRSGLCEFRHVRRPYQIPFRRRRGTQSRSLPARFQIHQQARRWQGMQSPDLEHLLHYERKAGLHSILKLGRVTFLDLVAHISSLEVCCRIQTHSEGSSRPLSWSYQCLDLFYEESHAIWRAGDLNPSKKLQSYVNICLYKVAGVSHGAADAGIKWKAFLLIT